MATKKHYPARTQNYTTVLENLKEIDFNLLAVQSGFKKREHRKIEVKQLVLCFMLMALKGRNTFQLWAEELGIATGKTVSKQAICKRVNGLFVEFTQSLLSEIFSRHIQQVTSKVKHTNALRNFNNILVQDSTILNLPGWLSKYYPGSFSQGKAKALLRIQLVIELRESRIVWFAITPYSKNDQSMSNSIFDSGKHGDLVIRDLGYFSLKVFQEMSDRGLSFISRIKPEVNIFDLKTGQKIDLIKTLRAKHRMDKWVLVGSGQKMRLRIVAIKLPEKIANEKIRKKRQNKDYRSNHSKDYYQLMRYNIYLTSEDNAILNLSQIAQTYGLRWRIEIIFKTWKSNFHLQELIPCNIMTSKERVESVVYLMLVFIIQFQLKIYSQIFNWFQTQKHPFTISILKLSRFMADRVKEILQMNTSELFDYIRYYCQYDKRLDRKNFNQKLLLS